LSFSRRSRNEIIWALAVSLLYSFFSSLFIYSHYNFIAKYPLAILKIIPGEFIYSGLWLVLFFVVRRIVRLLHAQYVGPFFRVLVHVLLFLLVPLTHLLAAFWLNNLLDPLLGIIYVPELGRLKWIFADWLFVNLVLYCIVLGMIFLLDAEKKNKQFAVARLQSELLQTQLQSMKTQLQPNFIFSVIEKLTHLVSRQPDLAVTLIAKLGIWLRCIQEMSARPFISLEEELRFFAAYLDIERLCLGLEFKVEADVDAAALVWPVPPLLLQPFMEKALDQLDGSGNKEMDMRLTGRIAGRRLAVGMRIHFQENMPPRARFEKNDFIAPDREKLAILYGKEFSLRSEISAENEMRIDLLLPLKEVRFVTGEERK